MLTIFAGPEYCFRADNPFGLQYFSGNYFDDIFCGNIQEERTDRHKIAGTVTVDGLPARRNILALERKDMSYVGATTSDPVTGKWKIQGLPEYPERSLIVFAMDTTGEYNAEVADYISQVATYVEPIPEPET